MTESVADATSDAIWPRTAGSVVGVVAVAAHPCPRISSSHALAHMQHRVADELALVAPPLLPPSTLQDNLVGQER